MPEEEKKPTIEDLQKQIEELQVPKEETPPVEEPKKFEDIKQYDLFKILKADIGLPILDVVPTHAEREGKIVLVKEGSGETMTFKFYAYIEGSWRYVNLT